MSVENKLKVVAALKTKASRFAHIEDDDLEIIQENVYRLQEQPAYFIKYITDGDALGKNEVRINQTILKQTLIPKPALLFTLELSEAIVAVWEWLDGNDLRYQNRNLLPQAFEQLGNFHLEQRHTGQVYSLVTHQPYATIKDLLEGELTFLTAFHDITVRQAAAHAFPLLEVGLATFIHGDMHPGNLRVTEQGLKFVDWGYCISSLCLFDLGYIQTVNFNESTENQPWWCITPEEASVILPAYYAACGLGEHDYNQTHQAVMLWNELWAYYNSIKHRNAFATKKCKQHLEQLIPLLRS